MIPPDPQLRVLARFWPRVQPLENGCWLWLGQRKPNGYSAFWSGERKVYAHRFAYELLIAPIPPGLDIDHLCRNRGCVNPTHLEPVTRKENLNRGIQRHPEHHRDHCPEGHPWVLRPWDPLRRYCPICNRAAMRAYYYRKKAERQALLEEGRCWRHGRGYRLSVRCVDVLALRAEHPAPLGRSLAA